MRILKYFIPIVALLIFTFCTANLRQQSENIDLSEIDLIGKWKNTGVNSFDSEELIESIIFLNDSIAEIYFKEDAKKNKLEGRWKFPYNKEINKTFSLNLESDLAVSYHQDERNSVLLLFKVKDENNKLMLTGNKMEFEKE